MSKYIISTDSTADLNEEIFSKRNIAYVKFPYESDGVTYYDDLGKTYPYEKFYADIKGGKMFKTSQPNIDVYMKHFEKLLKEGQDVLHIGFSSGLSGSFNSACLASEELKDKYENKVYCVDSLAASSGHGLLVYKAQDNLDEGMSLEDNIKWIEENRKKIIHWFFSSDLTSYVRGGRISKAAGFFGTTLQICPVMCVSDEGKLEVLEKTRTKKKAMKEMVEKMFNEVGPDYDDYCFIAHSGCLEDCKATAQLVKEQFPKVKEIKLFYIGSTIGSHAGPGTVALFYVGKKRAL